MRLARDPEQRYYLYLPLGVERPRGVFVTVHGISRNAKTHAKLFAALAERYGVVLIAPKFTKTRFPDYQRLGREGRGLRADRFLDRIVDEVRQLTGVGDNKLHMFGFSGGGQFVHRYAMAHPHKVARAVIGAAGWYSFPDARVAYPHGIGSPNGLADVDFLLPELLRVPVSVLVGEYDRARDPVLNQSWRIDLQQGHNRVERGRHWVEAMRSQAQAAGLPTEYRFQTLVGAGHDFAQAMAQGEMGELVFDFLFGTDPSASTRAEIAAEPALVPLGSPLRALDAR